MLSSETIHASCISIDGEAILLSGPSGAGKSDLAVRLMDRGAVLVSDDYTILTRVGAELRARAPENIAGKIEVRGVGILAVDAMDDVPVTLMFDLSEPADRLPSFDIKRSFAGVEIPILGLNAFEASAPIKVELALRKVKQL